MSSGVRPVYVFVGAILVGCKGDEAMPPDSSTHSDPIPSGWSEGTGLFEPLQENAVVALNGEVVVVGGIGSSVATEDRVEAYDPRSDSWRSLAPLPVVVHHANAVAHEGKIYVVGSLSPTFEQRGDVWIYDSESDSWSDGAPMTAGTERGGGAAVVVDGRIHVVGGLRSGEEVAMHSVYDPPSNSWSQLDDMPTPRDHLAAGSIDGVIYAVGGRNASINGHFDILEAWDGSWSTKAPMPTSRGGIAATVLAGRLHVFGGEGADNNRGVFAEHEAYDPATDSWEILDAMPTPRHGTGAAEIDGQIWVPGGADQAAFGAVATNEAWAP